MSKDFDKTDNSSFDDVSVTQSTFMHAVERRYSDVLVGIFNLIDAVAKQAKGGFFISNEHFSSTASWKTATEASLRAC